jgi:hypothetical protein
MFVVYFEHNEKYNNLLQPGRYFESHLAIK